MNILPNASNVAVTGGNFTSITNIIHSNKTASSMALDKLASVTAHTALHNAPARTDSTRCHAGTRVNIVEQLEGWALGSLVQLIPVFWLNGGAGAGKSAIMQTLAERFVAAGLALGSFFFSRTDATRNSADALVPTLAYQLVQCFPVLETFLEAVIGKDPLIFNKSLDHQFLHLLINPMKHLAERGILTSTSQSPRVFLIDGLDECNDPSQQQIIIQSMFAFHNHHQIPVRFLVASRVEPVISASFNMYYETRDLSSASIWLSGDVDSQNDVRRFLEAEFQKIREQHLFKTMIPLEWPSEDQVSVLIHKSSNHFVYAATAMRYISSSNDIPSRALDTVLGLESTRTHESPFSELDALYHHILGSALYRDQVLEILSFCLFALDTSMPAVSLIGRVIGCSRDDIHVFLCDVKALIRITPNDTVHILHASLGDFFFDKGRSKDLHIDRAAGRTRTIQQCFSLLPYARELDHSATHSSLNVQQFLALVITKLTLADTDGLHYDDMQRHGLHEFYVADWKYGVNPACGMIVNVVKQANFQDDNKLLTRYLEDFFDIWEPRVFKEMPHIAPSILPLLFSGFSTRVMLAIFTQTSNKITAFLGRNIFWGSRSASILDGITIEDLSNTRHNVNASPARLAKGADALLRYLTAAVTLKSSNMAIPESTTILWETPHRAWLRSAKSWKYTSTGSPLLASALHAQCLSAYHRRHADPRRLCKFHGYFARVGKGLPFSIIEMDLGLEYADCQRCIDSNYPQLLKALIWLLPRAGVSENLLKSSQKLLPQWIYWCWPKLAQRVRRSLDDYRQRMSQERLQELSSLVNEGIYDALVEKLRTLAVDDLD